MKVRIALRVLGVQDNASSREIRQVFLRTAKICHPDSPNGNEGKFKELMEAYNTLKGYNLPQSPELNPITPNIEKYTTPNMSDFYIKKPNKLSSPLNFFSVRKRYIY